MTEAFLHYLWLNGLFKKPLVTTLNEPVTIIHPGYHNMHAGPDFSNARLKIGDTLWAGNVEIHINSSDWFRHGHDADESYSNIALHVVYRDDSPGKFPDTPLCVLDGYIDMQLFDAYQRFLTTQLFVPCADRIKKIPEIDLTLWLERMLIEKLEDKAEYIEGILQISENDWEEVLYRILARSFGFSVNALPFEMLAQSVSWKILAHHADNLFQIEALLFGQAGLLNHELTDLYGQQLFKEYSFLRKKYHLVPMPGSLWKFLRMRPVNFPTIRIAQFASLISNNAGFLSRIIKAESIEEMLPMFNVKASEYWNNHFVFDKETKGKSKLLGSDSSILLIINALLPFMFVYGRATGNEELSSRTLSFFEQLPPEKNSVISSWEGAGVKSDNSFKTQALIHLKRNYCEKKECIKCRIGNILIKQPEFIKNV